MTDSATALQPFDQTPQYAWALQLQQENTLPRTDFYDAPDPLPSSPAGTLIRHQETTDYLTADAPLPGIRLLYHSRSSRGENVAASGVVLVPAGSPPDGGWPTVVNAHGTSGSSSRSSAPSLMRDLYHGDQMAHFLSQGYAVVAPDYAGLGTTGPHEFLNKTAAANDVINSLHAARTAVPGLSSNWVLWGHSQGGGAALAVAEQLHHRPDKGYLGAVVTSPGALLVKTVTHIATQPGLGGFLALVAAGAKIGEPGLQLERVLTPEAIRRLDQVRDNELGVVMAAYADLTGDDLVKPGYLSDPLFSQYLRVNSTGEQPVAGPVLLLQGEADVAIPTAVTGEVAVSLRRAGATVDYRTYPDLGHDTYPGVEIGIDDGAMHDILAWIADRFAAPSTTLAEGHRAS
jgi:alpha-beta hydrolase superfamily lysophospholipase